MSSVNLSKLALFESLIVSFGFMLLFPSLSTFSEVVLWIVAKPFLERIWAIFATREMHSPIPSICTVPCFFKIILHKNNPWLSLDSFRTRKISVSLNLGFSLFDMLIFNLRVVCLKLYEYKYSNIFHYSTIVYYLRNWSLHYQEWV